MSASVSSRPTLWRFFPEALALSMAVVFVVNGVLMWLAIGTHPGEPGESGFDLSNQYDRVLARAARQDSLGWHVTSATQGRIVTLRVTGADGGPLPLAEVRVVAQRPLGPLARTTLAFTGTSDALVATSPLPEPGQWDLLVTVSVPHGPLLTTTERVITR